MGLRYRWRPRLGPLRLNVTERGLRSVSLKLGPFTWNTTRGRLTTNLPGGLYHTATLPSTACRCTHRALQHDPACAACTCRRYRRTR
jgi:hypothetical protein